MRAKVLQLVACLLVCVQVPACSSVPQEQLQLYSEASGEAREAGAALYLALDDVVSRERGRIEGNELASLGEDCSPAEGVPQCFDPDDILAGSSASSRLLDPGIEARLVAFDAVTLYNESLIALASGATGETLENRLGTLTGVLNRVAQVAGFASGGALTPILSTSVIEAFTALAVRLETVRANAEARAAILGDAPLIEEAIDLLIADTPEVYALYLTAQGNIASSVSDSPFSPEFEAEYAKIALYHAALGEYVRLLGATRESHRALVDALSSDIDPVSELNAALEQAIEIRAAGIRFRDAIEAVGD